jgi:hypothetical protein
MFQTVRNREAILTMNFAWQGKYTEAMLELNREELPRRIDAAEEAIYQRLEELEHAPKTFAEELWALSDALRGLRVLAKTECQAGRSPEAGRPQRQEAS